MRRMTLLTFASITAIALTVAPVAATAQGYPGGGMGGMGGRHGGFGGGHGQHRQMSQDDMAKRFENMAALKPALKDIGLDNTQKDTLDKLEKAYRPQLGDYGRALWSVTQDGGADPDSVKALRSGARALRDQEFTEARGLLTTDQQPKFDQNVAKIHADEQKRDEQMHSRMGGDDGP